MKKTSLLIGLLWLPLLSFAQNLTTDEQKLYELIMEYRAQKNLPAIALSKSLTTVAQIHVKDLEENQPDKGDCNMHSWSDKGNWTPCCYTPDHARAKCMWEKPQELTPYTGYGFEISYWSSGGANAQASLNGWKGSSGHNSVIVNLGIWKKYNWQAIGIGIYGKYAVVWFGAEKDPVK